MTKEIIARLAWVEENQHEFLEMLTTESEELRTILIRDHKERHEQNVSNEANPQENGPG